MSADRTIAREEIAALLAPALGQDKSDEVVMSAARSLGITRSAYTGEEVRAIFEKLVEAEGLVGVVARFAVSRRDVDRLITQAERAAPERIGRPDFGATTSAAMGSAPAKRVATATVDILPLIAPALGVEKARDAIEAAAARQGVDIATNLSHAGALAVLDEMAKVEGIVGVVARFAKARFLLNPGE